MTAQHPAKNDGAWSYRFLAGCCKPFYSADFCEQFYEPEHNCISLLPVFVGYVGPDAPVRLNEEHSDFRWVSLEKARQMVSFSGQRQMLRHIEETFFEAQPSEHLRIEVNDAG